MENEWDTDEWLNGVLRQKSYKENAHTHTHTIGKKKSKNKMWNMWKLWVITEAVRREVAIGQPLVQAPQVPAGRLSPVMLGWVRQSLKRCPVGVDHAGPSRAKLSQPGPSRAKAEEDRPLSVFSSWPLQPWGLAACASTVRGGSRRLRGPAEIIVKSYSLIY